MMRHWMTYYSTKEDLMKHRPIMPFTWAFFFMVTTLIFGGLSQAQNSPSPSDNMKTFSVTDQTGFKEGRIRGEVVQLDGNSVVIKTKEGQEIELHRDATTKSVEVIKRGDQVEAEADDKHHILSVKPFSQSDASKTNAGKKK
jgi:hypothetical protein